MARLGVGFSQETEVGIVDYHAKHERGAPTSELLSIKIVSSGKVVVDAGPSKLQRPTPSVV